MSTMKGEIYTMLHARIIVLALVAILITAGVAVALGNVGKAGAQEYPPAAIRDTGIVEKREGGMCVYLLSLDDNRHPEDRRDWHNGRYELRHFLSIQSTFQHGGRIQENGRIEIGGGWDYIIRPTDDYGRDTYFHGMPTRAEAAIGQWYWNAFPPPVQTVGDIWVNLMARMLKICMKHCLSAPIRRRPLRLRLR